MNFEFSISAFNSISSFQLLKHFLILNVLSYSLNIPQKVVEKSKPITQNKTQQKLCKRIYITWKIATIKHMYYKIYLDIMCHLGYFYGMCGGSDGCKC
jgi:hypothetical protein